MLYSLYDDKPINDIIHKADYDRWKARLTAGEYQAIVDELNQRIDTTPPGKEVVTSSWIPGSDWDGTVWNSIYTKACDHNPNEAALCFGVFMWAVMLDRPEFWAFGRYEKDGIPIRGLTYFVVHPSAGIPPLHRL
jgi:hypothetical protein